MSELSWIVGHPTSVQELLGGLGKPPPTKPIMQDFGTEFLPLHLKIALNHIKPKNDVISVKYINSVL